MFTLYEVTYKTPAPRQKTVLSKINLSVNSGENIMISGDNGSGKSTLVDIILKNTIPASGQVVSEPEKIAVVFEDYNDQIFFSTVDEELDSEDINSDDKKKVYDILKIEELRLKASFELSYSEKARLVMALAYFSGRNHFIIDCPPKDDLIDSVIREIACNKSVSMLILLPEGDSRIDESDWKHYKLKECRIEIV